MLNIKCQQIHEWNASTKTNKWAVTITSWCGQSLKHQIIFRINNIVTHPPTIVDKINNMVFCKYILQVTPPDNNDHGNYDATTKRVLGCEVGGDLGIPTRISQLSNAHFYLFVRFPALLTAFVLLSPVVCQFMTLSPWYHLFVFTMLHPLSSAG